jgi:SNF2 family DNA or RNA helicase
MIEVRFDYDPALVSGVKTATAAFWRKYVPDHDDRHWRVAYSPKAAESLIAFGVAHGFEIDPKIKLTRTDGPLALPEIGPAIDQLEAGSLRRFQQQAVWYAQQQTKRNGRVEMILGDQMGLGKTITTLAILRDLGGQALIVCPASLKLMWAEAIREWLGMDSGIISGQKPKPLSPDGIQIINYDILSYWADALLRDRSWSVLVFDESHKLKSTKAKRSKAALKLTGKSPSSNVLLLTGTPALSRPYELLNQLKVVRQFEKVGGDWRHYVTRYCGGFRQRMGNREFWNTDGATHLAELNQKLRETCYVRRTKDEVLTELPDKSHVRIPVDIDNRDEYNKAEQDIVRWVMEQAEEDREFRESIAHLSAQEQAEEVAMHKLSEGFKARRAETLVQIAKLKQLSAQGKLAHLGEWVADFLDGDQKLVIFAWHREIVERVATLLGDPEMVIHGGTPIETRQALVQRFQTDPECRFIVGNIQALGVGLTLTAASDVLFVEYPWTPGDLDQAIDRCHRIGQDNSVTAWYMVGSETIDTDILELISRKSGVVDAVTEGRSTGKSEMLSSLVRKVRERQHES